VVYQNINFEIFSKKSSDLVTDVTHNLLPYCTL